MTIKKHTAAFLRCVAESLDPQPPVDVTVQAKLIADMLSGQFGRGIVGRSFKASDGVDVSY